MAFALASYAPVVFFLSSLLLHLGDARRQHAVVRLQARSPHGLAFQEPMPFPPTAFEFFHPKLLLPPASAPMPLASASSFYPAATSAKVRADEEEEEAGGEHSSPAGRGGVGASGVAAVALGLAFVVIAAVLASYVVVVRRRSDVRRAKGTVQPDA